MNSWSKQTEDLFQAWTDTQTRVWSGWLDAAEQQTAQHQLADVWRKAVDTWESAVKGGLDAQREWSRQLADNVAAVPNLPKDLASWAEQTQKLGQRWSGAQKELWESYFGMVRKAVPVKMLGTLDAENQKLVAAWQESVEKMVAAQSTWTRMWTEQTAPPKTARSKS